jgi:hypothetical protein
VQRVDDHPALEALPAARRARPRRARCAPRTRARAQRAAPPAQGARGRRPECSKRVDETWNHRPKQTHHFHRYHGVVSAAKLNPPFLRPSWEYKAAPMPPLVQELDAQSLPEPRVTFLAWKYPSIKVTPPPTDHGCDVDWLDIYMCCECPVNIMATRSPIPGIVPRRLLDDLIRERMSVGKQPLYVILALETIIK